MAKRSFACGAWTPTAVADASNLHQACMDIGCNAGFGLLVSEIYIGGRASTSTVNNMVFARDSTLVVGPTTLVAPNTDGPMNTLTAAAQVAGASSTCIQAATTMATRTANATSARLYLTHNAFGGLVRWVAYPGEEWGIVGNTVNISQSSLSCVTDGGGNVSSHIIYEAY
jgi:hypothetical protein